MKDNSDIDNFFKRKLADELDDPTNWEHDWLALEEMMDKPKKRRGIIYWLPALSAVAALVLLVLGWWWFKPETNDQQNLAQQIAKTQEPKQHGITDQNKNETEVEPRDFTQVVKQREERLLNKGNVFTALPNRTAGNTSVMAITDKNSQNVDKAVNNVQDTTGTPFLALTTEKAKPGISDNNAEHVTASPDTPLTDKGVLAAPSKVTTKKSLLGKPQFALAILGAPDINGVSSFGQAKTGTNVGLVLSASVKKLTVSTGVLYSYKPYSMAFQNYSGTSYYSKTDPYSVLADCRMLDIPINIDYQLYNKSRNKISVGTGLSSYIMLRENYTYQYADPAKHAPRSYAIASPGQYFFGVVNLQATYTRQVNAKVGISLQPYLKLPLGNVGAGNVRLQSAGVALGVNWNLNTLVKP